MKVTVKMVGAGNVRGMLARATDEGRTVARREVKRSALNVQNGAKRRAPVDKGRLRNSIAHEITNGGLDAKVGTNVEYARRIEFGYRGTIKAHEVRAHTRVVGTTRAAAGKQRRGSVGVTFVSAHTRGPYPVTQRARPYLFPALEEERPHFQRRIRAGLKGKLK